jgi:hypothetical protein
MDYFRRMAGNPTTVDSERRMTMVPVTTMEEVPLLSERERAEMTASLHEAENRIQSGHAVDYDPNTFKDHLIEIYRKADR